MPSAVIVGSAGQDGTYLSRLLRDKGYLVVGIDQVPGHERVAIRDSKAVREVIGKYRPDELYYLAAYHHSAESPRPEAGLIAESFAVNTLAFNNFLEALVTEAPSCRVFYAASSHVFGNPTDVMQDENTVLNPQSAYAISKAAGMHLCRHYRGALGLYCSTGILYNHESPLRHAEFVTKKIVRSAVNIRRGLQEELVLGSLEAKVDWGYAPDYVAAMWSILQLDRGDDFIIATGLLHTVAEFAEAAFQSVGLQWEKYVREKQGMLAATRPTGALCGDSSKLRRLTSWRPSVSFAEMVRLLVVAELEECGEMHLLADSASKSNRLGASN